MVASQTAAPVVEGQSAADANAVRDPQGKRLVANCLAGDPEARARFQNEFGELVYRFLRCVDGTSAVEPGDFYVYVFDGDRVFKRLRSYEGRASLGPYLRGFVLPSLLQQFQARVRSRTLATISMESEGVPEPVDPASSIVDPPVGTFDANASTAPGPGSPLDELEPEKRLLVKLLYIEDSDLDPEEVQLLAELSGRSIRESVAVVEESRRSVRRREEAKRGKIDEAESATQWILQYERRAARMAESLGSLPPDSTRAERLRNDLAELERKREWRQTQRERALAESERAVVTLPYKEIAHILNARIGTISAQITRLRQELASIAARRAGQGKKVR